MMNFFLLLTGILSIHEPAVSGIKHDRVSIEWTTSEKSFGTVYYGETETLGKKIIDPSFSKGHRLSIRGLKPETPYYFKVEGWSKEEKKKTTTGLYTFKTAFYEGPDETILKILSPPVVTVVSPNSVTISWQTNKASRATILYGMKLDRPRKIFGEFETTDHILMLTPLLPESRYFYQVSTRDSAGKTVRSSYSSFVTPKGVSGPLFTEEPAVASRKTGSIKVQWRTDRPCKSWIQWGTVPLKSFQKDKTVTPGYSREHLLKLSGLQPNKRYFYTIHLEDRRGRKFSSDIFSLKTEAY